MNTHLEINPLFKKIFKFSTEDLFFIDSWREKHLSMYMPLTKIEPRTPQSKVLPTEPNCLGLEINPLENLAKNILTQECEGLLINVLTCYKYKNKTTYRHTLIFNSAMFSVSRI